MNELVHRLPENRVLRTTAIASLVLVCCGSDAQQQQANPQPITVRCLAFSPDSKSLAVVYRGGTPLVVWDLETCKQTLSHQEETGINAVAYSPKQNLLAIAPGNNVKLLDSASCELRRELAGHAQPVRALAFTPDGKQLLTAGMDRTVKLWNLETGEAQCTLSDFQAPVVGISVSLDGKWLATTCGQEDAVKLWNLESLDDAPRKFEAGRGSVPTVAFSADSRLLAIPSYAASVKLIDVATGNEEIEFSHGSTYCATFSPDGKWLALATQYKEIDLIPIGRSPSDDQRRNVAALMDQFQNDDYARREAASKELESLAAVALPQLRAGLESTSAEVRIRCRRLVQGFQNTEFAVKLVGHESQPTWVAFSPSGELLASGDSQGIVKIWNVAQAKEVATLSSK